MDDPLGAEGSDSASAAFGFWTTAFGPSAATLRCSSGESFGPLRCSRDRDLATLDGTLHLGNGVIANLGRTPDTTFADVEESRSLSLGDRRRSGRRLTNQTGQLAGFSRQATLPKVRQLRGDHRPLRLAP